MSLPSKRNLKTAQNYLILIATSPALKFFSRRIGQSILVMLLVIVVSFIILQNTPGDLVDILGGHSQLTEEQMAELRRLYGLDRSAGVQFFYYIANLLRFDLGYSPRNSAPVLSVIAERWPVTALLVVSSVIISMSIGAVIGVASARRAGTVIDVGLGATMLILYATPGFIVALVLTLVFSVKFTILPISGFSTIGDNSAGLAYVADVATHLAMPVATLCSFYIAIYARLTRASMLEVLQLDFVRTARAKGLNERKVVYSHALRNALLPLITMVGLQISSLAGGAVVTETIFGLPGMGRTAYDAVLERDTNLLLGVLFVSSLSIVIINLMIDVVYMLVDPRVRV